MYISFDFYNFFFQKVPKPIKENTDDDIDRIMKDLEDLEDSAPIMVLRNGALLTGMAAPRKETLRKARLIIWELESHKLTVSLFNYVLIKFMSDSCTLINDDSIIH